MAVIACVFPPLQSFFDAFGRADKMTRIDQFCWYCGCRLIFASSQTDPEFLLQRLQPKALA